MSKFAAEKINGIEPYVAGEQPRDRRYIKLNTNENPYYTSPHAVERLKKEVVSGLNRYSDPESLELICAIADYYDCKKENVLVTNGSDEALAFCFMAYCTQGVCYPDVTYGFYSVIANLFNCQSMVIPLISDLKVNVNDYLNAGKTVVLANPNAQTGIEMSLNDIEKIISSNPDNIVIIDQAYADFGKVNIIPLVKKYKNLIAVNTFSKSRSLAGARVGYVIADEAIIEDLKKVKNSFHPYNVNTLSSALASAAIKDDAYFKDAVKKVIEERVRVTAELKKLSFNVVDSSANFVLAESTEIGGEKLYSELKRKGVLVRHISQPRIENFVRITIGTMEENDGLLSAIRSILEEIK